EAIAELNVGRRLKRPRRLRVRERQLANGDPSPVRVARACQMQCELPALLGRFAEHGRESGVRDEISTLRRNLRRNPPERATTRADLGRLQSALRAQRPKNVRQVERELGV